MGPAASHVDLAQLSGLERHAGVIHDAADARHVLGVRIVGAALAAAAVYLLNTRPRPKNAEFFASNALA